MNIEQELAKLTVEMEYVKQTVETIDSRLEAMHLGSRIAVIEDRQGTIFRLINGGFAFFGTILSALIIWLFTR